MFASRIDYEDIRTFYYFTIATIVWEVASDDLCLVCGQRCYLVHVAVGIVG